MCQELADLGMQLARAIAAKALRDMAPPDPQEAHPEPEQAPPPPPPKPAPDPALAFARISRAVRQCIALETQLIAGPAQAARAKPQRPPPDPRRAPLQNIFDALLRANPNRAQLARETAERLDHDLATDPDGNLSIPTIVANIVNDLGITLDFAQVPDDILEQLIPEGFVPDELDELDEDDLNEAAPTEDEDPEDPNAFEELKALFCPPESTTQLPTQSPPEPQPPPPAPPALPPFLANHIFEPGSVFDRCIHRPPWTTAR